MCAKRMLRRGVGVDTLSSRPMVRVDERQGALDLESPVTETAEERIFRLSYDLAAARTILATAVIGRSDQIRPVAKVELLATGYANQISQLATSRSKSVSGIPDAAQIRGQIEMVLEEAQALINALVEDARARGLSVSGSPVSFTLPEIQAADRE